MRLKEVSMGHTMADISQYIYLPSRRRIILSTIREKSSGPLGENGKDEQDPGAPQPTALTDRGRCDLEMLCNMWTCKLSIFDLPSYE